MATYTINSIVLPNGDTCELQDTTYPLAAINTNGLMSATDKVKLDGIEIAGFNEAMTYLNLPILNASEVET